MGNLLLTPKWVTLLLTIYNHEYGRNEVRQAVLKKRTGMTAGHVIELLQMFEERHLIQKRRDGRNCYITLTKKGVQVCSLLHSTCDIINKSVKDGCIQKEI
jgi:DNA-binding MarR family transcriptional regulator